MSQNVTRILLHGPDLSIEILQTNLRAAETRFGPLIAISPFDRIPPSVFTCTTHEFPDAPPASSDLILTLLADPPDLTPPAGKRLVCVGDCFVDGMAAMVAAFR